MAKVGRKKKYDESFPKEAEELAKKGLTNKEIFKQLGIGKSTFYNTKKTILEFSDSIKKGREDSIEPVENSLYARALGYDYEEQVTEERISEDGTAHLTVVKTTKKHMPPDTIAGIFVLKNQAPEKWKDGKNIEIAGKDGDSLAPKPIEITIKRE